MMNKKSTWPVVTYARHCSCRAVCTVQLAYPITRGKLELGLELSHYRISHLEPERTFDERKVQSLAISASSWPALPTRVTRTCCSSSAAQPVLQVDPDEGEDQDGDDGISPSRSSVWAAVSSCPFLTKARTKEKRIRRPKKRRRKMSTMLHKALDEEEDDYEEGITATSSLQGHSLELRREQQPDQRSHLTNNGLRRRFELDLLFALFGISAWAAINGLWVESPVLVQRLPEGWNLASYIVVLTQVANLGPVLYSCLRNFYGSDNFEKWSIHVIMALGTLSCILLIFYWDEQTWFMGKDRSVAFFVLTGFLAIVDCTSSVLYLPFVSHFQPEYVQPLLVGEGLSGFVPSLASLIQGAGGNPSCVNKTKMINGSAVDVLSPVYAEPRYSISTFFIFLTFVMIASWAAFIAINVFDFAKAERVPLSERKKTDEEERADLNRLLLKVEMSRPRFFALLTLQSFICCLMNGIIASISTYSTLPYGNTTYHLATNFSVISGPVAAFLVFTIHKSRQYQKPIIPLTILGSAAAVYIITVAASSPKTPLQGTLMGSVIIVLTWLFYHGCFSYVKACIAGTMRNSSFGGHKALFYYGVFTQIGSFTGAFVMFFIVNFTKSFHSYNPCK